MKIVPKDLENSKTDLRNDPQSQAQHPGSRKKIFIIVGMIIVLVVVAAITTTAVLLTVKQPEEDGQEDGDDVVEKDKFCDRQPEKCSGVSQDVINLIRQKDYDDDETQSVLQLASNYEQIESKSSEQVYEKLFRSVECAQAIFGQGYLQDIEEIHNIYLNSTQKLDQYINMIDNVNGEPISLSLNGKQHFNCNFSISGAHRRRMQANQDRCTDPPQDAGSLHFINGVGFTPKGAQQNLQQIKKAVQQRGLNFSSFVCSAPWRKKKGFIGDLKDVWLMKLQEKHQLQIDQTILKKIGLFLQGDSLDDEEAKQLLENSEYRDTILNSYNEHIYSKISSPDINFNVHVHVELISQSIRQGKQVVLVAHSQGTMYANTIYARLDEDYRQSVTMVFLGAAAKQVADGNNLYITNKADLVIGSLRLVTSSQISPLQANVGPKYFFPFAHNCVGYIKKFNELFKEHLKTAYNLAIKPNATQSDGVITVELLWDDQPDLDLHIYEPQINSTNHVYYANRHGISGYLDVDDTDGYGPEHYYAKCQSLYEGVYEFKLNYYLGFGASKYTVRVKAGVKIKIFGGQTDSDSLGRLGEEDPPINLFKIKVTVNEIWGNYDYEIIDY